MIRRWKLFAFVALRILVDVSMAHASDNTPDNQTWIDYNVKYILSSKWSLGGDLGYRTQFGTSYYMSVFRPKTEFKINNRLYLSATLGHFYKNHTHQMYEIRPAQQVDWHWRLGRFAKLTHTVRLEERLFYRNEIDQRSYQTRGRYKINLVTPDFSPFHTSSYFYTSMNMELFSNLSNSNSALAIDATRLVIGLGHKLSSSLKYQFDFVRQGMKTMEGGAFNLSNNIFRIRFLQTLSQNVICLHKRRF